jgi:hypothetical protein
MAQVLDLPSHIQATNPGDTIASALQGLAQRKIQLMNQQHERKQMMSAFSQANMAPDKAMALAQLFQSIPENARPYLMQQVGPSIASQLFAGPPQGQNAPGQGQTDQMAIPQQGQGNQEFASPNQRPLPSAEEKPSFEQLMNQLSSGYKPTLNPYSAMQSLGQGGLRPELTPRPQQQMSQAQQQVQQQPIQDQQKKSMYVPYKNITPQQELKHKEFNEIRREKAFESTKNFREETQANENASRENGMRLDRMITLNKKDELQNPMLYTALKGMGMNVSALQNEDTQEFEKLTNDFLKNARAIFGSRVTNFEMSQFLKTVPTLMQTKGGRERVIRNLKLAGKAATLRGETMRNIIEQNNDTPPLDLAEKIEKRIGGKLDAISKQFASGEKEGKADFEKLPDPILYKDKKIIDHATGKMLQSNGKEWTKVE